MLPSTRLLTISIAVLLCLVCASFAQQGATSARDAFPVPSGVQVSRDIVYAQYGTRSLKLDLYRPSGGAVLPGLIAVRGGGLLSGDKEAFGFIAGNLAAHGFVAASIEFRTLNESPFPVPLQDVNAAIAWMRAHGREYGINTNQIGLIGGSSGAHQVLLAALSKTASFQPAGAKWRPVQAVVAMAAPSDVTENGGDELGFGPVEPRPTKRRSEASPITYVTRDAPPTLLIHSDADDVVPYKQSPALLERYRTLKARAQLITVPGAPHAFWNSPQWFPKALDDAAKFFQETLKP